MQDFRLGRRRSTLLLVRFLACTVLSLLVLAAPAFAKSKTGGGTAAPTTPPPAAAAAPAPAPTAGAALAAPGVAVAPAGAPAAVRGAIRAGNALQALPYRYGGGHDTFADTACMVNLYRQGPFRLCLLRHSRPKVPVDPSAPRTRGPRRAPRMLHRSQLCPVVAATSAVGESFRVDTSMIRGRRRTHARRSQLRAGRCRG